MLFATVMLAIATIVLAVATIFLVRVTAYYARQTNRMVVEMQQQREDAALTFIVFKHSEVGDQANGNKAARHHIVNLGPGTALQIHAKIDVLRLNERSQRIPESKPYDVPALGAGDEHEVFLELANYQIKNFEADYADVLRRPFAVKQELKDNNTGEARYWMNGKELW